MSSIGDTIRRNEADRRTRKAASDAEARRRQAERQAQDDARRAQEWKAQQDADARRKAADVARLESARRERERQRFSTFTPQQALWSTQPHTR